MSKRLARTLATLAAAWLLTLFLPLGARAAMQESGGASPDRASTAIVQVSGPAHMASVRARLEAAGAIVIKTFRWNAYVVSVPSGMDPARFSAVARGIDGVRIAQANGAMKALGSSATNDPLFPSQWGLPDIGAPSAWSTGEGAGMSVAVIDTGIDATQPDLAGRVVLFRNYVNPSLSAADDEGHGTHVAGIVAAIRNNGIEGSGTAPKATLYAFKVLGATGSGDEASVAAAIRDAVDLTPCRIISMSLGGPVGDQGDAVLASAVAYAESKGAIVIAAAGNDGITAASYPAALPGVIGVGAVDSRNRLASFSNYGPTDLDLVAPGVNILSTVPGSTTASWSGTSMATPFVSGSAALVWAAHPGLTATQLADVLESSAQDLGVAGVDASYGHGLVRPDLALAALATPEPTPTPTPTPTPEPTPTPTPTPAPTPEPTPTPTPTPTPAPTPAPKASTTLTVAMSRTSMLLHRTTTLSGVLTPGLAHDAIRVYVMRPGSKVWSLLSTRFTTSRSAGGAKWSYAYKPTRRGAYKLRVRYPGSITRKASTSRTLSLRVR